MLIDLELGGREMHLSTEDIERLGDEYKSRLRKAFQELPAGIMTLSQLQDWMLRNNIENPELLETMIKKFELGATTEKKTAHTVEAD